MQGSGAPDTSPEDARSAEPGLRQRKRSETKLALEAAALDLTIEVGLESLTVEQIAERANVSRRTFFNYFATKEDALVGEFWDGPSAPELFTQPGEAAGPVLHELKSAVVEYVRTRAAADGLLDKRMRVLAVYPQLVLGHMARAAAALEAYSERLSSLLAERAGEKPSPRSAAEARMLLHLCAAVLKHATDEYRRDPQQGAFQETIARSFELLVDIKERYL